MNFSPSWLILFGILRMQASENPGIRMTIQLGPPGNMSRQTVYLQADRKRMEFRNSVGPRPDGSGQIYGPRLAAITRCDLGQSFELNLDASEYTAGPYPPKPLTPEQIKARGLQTPLSYASDKPTLRIEVMTTDTGERKEILGLTARHVITTRKQIPLEGSHSQPQESVTDGWYFDSKDIDLNQRLSCDRWLSKGKPGHAYSWVTMGNATQPRERPEFVRIGEPETGFALHAIITSTNTFTLPDGTQKQADSKFETKVTEFEEGPLDPALFEIPPGFKQVAHIERNPPASAFDQPKNLWQRLMDSVARLFNR